MNVSAYIYGTYRPSIGVARSNQYADVLLQAQAPFHPEMLSQLGIPSYDEQVEPARRAKALDRLRRYAGQVDDTTPLATLARARYEERGESGLLQPTRVEVEQSLDNLPTYLKGIGKLFDTYDIAGSGPVLAALTSQLENYAKWTRDVVIPALDKLIAQHDVSPCRNGRCRLAWPARRRAHRNRRRTSCLRQGSARGVCAVAEKTLNEGGARRPRPAAQLMRPSMRWCPISRAQRVPRSDQQT